MMIFDTMWKQACIVDLFIHLDRVLIFIGFEHTILYDYLMIDLSILSFKGKTGERKKRRNLGNKIFFCFIFSTGKKLVAAKGQAIVTMGE